MPGRGGREGLGLGASWTHLGGLRLPLPQRPPPGSRCGLGCSPGCHLSAAWHGVCSVQARVSRVGWRRLSAKPMKKQKHPLHHVQNLLIATSVSLLWLHFTLTPALWMGFSSLLRKWRTREVR